MKGDRYAPRDCLIEATSHDFLDTRKRAEDIYKWFPNVFSRDPGYEQKHCLLQLFFRKPYGKPVPEDVKQARLRESHKRA
eukprot:6349429-Karenia_brevis.AAC.1